MMYYNSVNDIISSAYNSIYKKGLRRRITESEDSNKNNNLHAKYKDLVDLLDIAENGKILFHQLTQNLNDEDLFKFANNVTSNSIPKKQERKGQGSIYSGNYKIVTVEVIPSHDEIWDGLLNYYYTSGDWNERQLKRGHKNELYTKVFPYIDSKEKAQEIKKALNTDIEIPVYSEASAETNSAKTSTAADGKSVEQKSGEENKTNVNTEQSGTKTSSTTDSQSATTTSTATSSVSGATDNKKPVKKVLIPANIDEETIKAYMDDLNKQSSIALDIRRRLRIIEQLQSEIEDSLKRSQQTQPQTDDRNYAPTTIPAYAQPQQPQQPQANKPEEEEGGFWNGVKRIGRGVVDAGTGLINGGLDAAGGLVDAAKSGVNYVKNAFS